MRTFSAISWCIGAIGLWAFRVCEFLRPEYGRLFPDRVFWRGRLFCCFLRFLGLLFFEFFACLGLRIGFRIPRCVAGGSLASLDAFIRWSAGHFYIEYLLILGQSILRHE